jgi:hypothetical protein
MVADLNITVEHDRLSTCRAEPSRLLLRYEASEHDSKSYELRTFHSFYPIRATCPRSRNHSALLRIFSDFVVPSITSLLPLPLLLPLTLPLLFPLLFPSVTSPLPLPLLFPFYYFLLLLPATSCVTSVLPLPLLLPFCHFLLHPPAISRGTSFVLLPVPSLMPRPLSYPFCYFLLLPTAPTISRYSLLPLPVLILL